jgi:hypothetical protein
LEGYSPVLDLETYTLFSSLFNDTMSDAGDKEEEYQEEEEEEEEGETASSSGVGTDIFSPQPFLQEKGHQSLLTACQLSAANEQMYHRMSGDSSATSSGDVPDTPDTCCGHSSVYSCSSSVLQGVEEQQEGSSEDMRVSSQLLTSALQQEELFKEEE